MFSLQSCFINILIEKKSRISFLSGWKNNFRSLLRCNKVNKRYWRPFIYSSLLNYVIIKLTDAKEGLTGDISCKIEYIGAICNSCDI